LVLSNSAGSDYKKGDFEKAALKYNSVLNSTFSSKIDKFDASYGLGNVEYQNNNFQKAADFYKQALKINPYDNDAKHNLELSLKKLKEQQQDKKEEQSSQSKENKQQDKKDDKQGKDKQQQNQGKQEKKEQSSKQSSKEQSSNEQSSKEKDSKQGSEQKQQNAQGTAQSAQADKKDGKEKSAAVLLNYYNEVDKNADKLRNKIQKPLLNQPQEDW